MPDQIANSHPVSQQPSTIKLKKSQVALVKADGSPEEEQKLQKMPTENLDASKQSEMRRSINGGAAQQHNAEQNANRSAVQSSERRQSQLSRQSVRELADARRPSEVQNSRGGMSCASPLQH